MAASLSTITHVPFVDLAAQYASIQEEVEQAIGAVLRQTDFILGRAVAEFEDEYAAFCGARCAVGVDTGTAALELIMRAYGIGAGDEVITVANTFVATALAISRCGATPVLVDIDAQSYNLDPALLEAAITPRTKAIMPVHLYGQPVDMDGVLAVARRHGLLVIEDACQAHGATYKGQPVGALGDAGAFSFYPSKNLGAYGDGGIVVTNDERIADTIKMLRNYGQRIKYQHEALGYNHRLDTLHAAVLRVKLRYLPEWNAARRRHAASYAALLHATPLALMHEQPHTEPVYHLYVVRHVERDELQQHLARHGIATAIHYPTPIHLQPALAHLGYRRGDLPISERYSKQIVSLPMYPELSEQQIAATAAAVQSFFAQLEPQPEPLGWQLNGDVGVPMLGGALGGEQQPYA